MNGRRLALKLLSVPLVNFFTSRKFSARTKVAYDVLSNEAEKENRSIVTKIAISWSYQNELTIFVEVKLKLYNNLNWTKYA